MKQIDSKISATLLEFGEPLITPMAEEGIEPLRAALHYVVVVWNAYALSMSQWGQDRKGLVELQRVRAQLESEGAPAQMLQLLDELVVRRERDYGDDWRAVGDWELVVGATGDPTFRCEARKPLRARSRRTDPGT